MHPSVPAWVSENTEIWIKTWNIYSTRFSIHTKYEFVLGGCKTIHKNRPALIIYCAFTPETHFCSMGWKIHLSSAINSGFCFPFVSFFFKFVFRLDWEGCVAEYENQPKICCDSSCVNLYLAWVEYSRRGIFLPPPSCCRLWAPRDSEGACSKKGESPQIATFPMGGSPFCKLKAELWSKQVCSVFSFSDERW